MQVSEKRGGKREGRRQKDRLRTVSGDPSEILWPLPGDKAEVDLKAYSSMPLPSSFLGCNLVGFVVGCLFLVVEMCAKVDPRGLELG